MVGVAHGTFDGSARSQQNLVGMIAEGRSLNPNISDALELRGGIERPMYAIMIPATWNYKPDKDTKDAFILSTEYDCTDSDECPEEAPGSHHGLYNSLSSDASQKTCHCYGGKWFFLVQARGIYCQSAGGTGTGSICNIRTLLEAPKGLDALDGKSWGGLTKKSFVQGYVVSFSLRCYLSVLFFLRSIAGNRDANKHCV
jgi:hypothetical protein